VKCEVLLLGMSVVVLIQPMVYVSVCMCVLQEHPMDTKKSEWGLFSFYVPTRTGRECRRFYHYLRSGLSIRQRKPKKQIIKATNTKNITPKPLAVNVQKQVQNSVINASENSPITRIRTLLSTCASVPMKVKRISPPTPKRDTTHTRAAPVVSTKSTTAAVHTRSTDSPKARPFPVKTRSTDSPKARPFPVKTRSASTTTTTPTKTRNTPVNFKQKPTNPTRVKTRSVRTTNADSKLVAKKSTTPRKKNLVSKTTTHRRVLPTSRGASKTVVHNITTSLTSQNARKYPAGRIIAVQPGVKNARRRSSGSTTVQKSRVQHRRTVTAPVKVNLHRTNERGSNKNQRPASRVPARKIQRAIAVQVVPSTLARTNHLVHMTYSLCNRVRVPIHIQNDQKSRRTHKRLYRSFMATKNAVSSKPLTLAPHNHQKFHPFLMPNRVRTLDEVRQVELKRFVSRWLSMCMRNFFNLFRYLVNCMHACMTVLFLLN